MTPRQFSPRTPIPDAVSTEPRITPQGYSGCTAQQRKGMEAMTARRARRISAYGGTVRRMRAVVITLFAVLMVLIHHETTAGTAAPIPTSGTSASVAASAMSQHHQGHTSAMHASTPAPPASDRGEGACSAMASQHCSAAVVNTVHLTPPTALCLYCADDSALGLPSGRKAPGTPSRAPPDLSALSRFLL